MSDKREDADRKIRDITCGVCVKTGVIHIRSFFTFRCKMRNRIAKIACVAKLRFVSRADPASPEPFPSQVKSRLDNSRILCVNEMKQASKQASVACLNEMKMRLIKEDALKATGRG